MNFLARLFGKKISHGDVQKVVNLDDVFSLTAIPSLNFIDRSEERDEIRDLKAALQTPGKLVCIHGESKSGKTTFVRDLAAGEGRECIRIEGPNIQDVDTFWNAIGEKLKIAIQDVISKTETVSSQQNIKASASGSLWSPLGSLSSRFEVEALKEKAEQLSMQNRAIASIRQTVIETVADGEIWIVVDDFHMACRGRSSDGSEFHAPDKARRIRHSIFEDIKSLVSEDRVKFVFISIPREPIDVLSSKGALAGDTQLSGRVSIEEFPGWSAQELIKIPLNGFELLKMEMGKQPAGRIATSSLGSPLNTHQICHRICLNAEVRSSTQVKADNRYVSLKQVKIAIQDFVRSMDLYDGYCERILELGSSKTGATIPFRNRMVGLNEAIAMGLAKSYIHSEFGLRVDKLKNRIGDIFPRNRWSEANIASRLSRMAEAEIITSISSNSEFSQKHQPIIFDQEALKVYLVDPGLSMYLGEKYRRDLKSFQ